MVTLTLTSCACDGLGLHQPPQRAHPARLHNLNHQNHCKINREEHTACLSASEGFSSDMGMKSEVVKPKLLLNHEAEAEALTFLSTKLKPAEPKPK